MLRSTFFTQLSRSPIRFKSTLAGTAESLTDAAAQASAKAGDVVFGALDGTEKLKDSLKKEETGSKPSVVETTTDVASEATERVHNTVEQVQYKK